MDQKVVFASDRLPAWSRVAEFLASRGYPVQMRMIDGALAFPDELPGEDWRELRVGTAQGMVTLRREPDGLTLVTWGNADANLRQAWNALTWAVAHMTGGSVHMAEGEQRAEEFVRTAELPAPLKSAAQQL
jgi:hypothetical protein